jgi:hypothetical protein
MNHTGLLQNIDLIHHYPSDTPQILQHPHDIDTTKMEENRFESVGDRSCVAQLG